MTNNSTLLPCPFCGLAPQVAISDDDTAIMCGNDNRRLIVGVPATTHERAIKHWNTRAASRPAQEPDDDHPDCSTAREVELYDALMLLAGLMLNKQQQLYRNGMQGSIRVAPVVSKALRLPLTGENEK